MSVLGSYMLFVGGRTVYAYIHRESNNGGTKELASVLSQLLSKLGLIWQHATLQCVPPTQYFHLHRGPHDEVCRANRLQA